MSLAYLKLKVFGLARGLLPAPIGINTYSDLSQWQLSLGSRFSMGGNAAFGLKLEGRREVLSENRVVFPISLTSFQKRLS